MATVAVPADLALADKRWTMWHTAGVTALIPATGAAGALIPWAAGASAGWARLVAWLAILALLTALTMVIGHGVTAQAIRGVFIDDRNRVSTARVQVGIWGAIVLSGYLAAVLANAALHLADPLLVTVPQTLWAAMGVSTTSFVASPFMLHQRKKQGGKMAKNPEPTNARWRDMVTGEEESTTNSVDIAKLQMVLVTIILVLAYGIALGYALYTEHGKITTLPKVNDAFAILLAISHGGYLARKAAPKGGDVAPKKA
ncbi:MAG: hypothetical protein ACRDLM_07475 [Gaiellaceae bacterium]